MLYEVITHDEVPALVFAAELPKDLERHGRSGLQLSGPVAVEARFVQNPAQALARSLARHLDQAERRHRRELVSGVV